MVNVKDLVEGDYCDYHYHNNLTQVYETSKTPPTMTSTLTSYSRTLAPIEKNKVKAHKRCSSHCTTRKNKTGPISI